MQFCGRFGAGSEFGRDAREEARKKKFGIVARKYRPEDQPWILKVGGKNGKKSVILVLLVFLFTFGH